MAKQSLNTLIGWFITNAIPTQNQFRDVFLSFWHKDEKLPMSAIDQLPETLNELSQSGNATSWGKIGGSIENQNDLITAFQGKADLEGGKVPLSQLPAMTGGSGAWGDIDGNIEDQEDLQEALGAKADLQGGKVPISQLPSNAVIEMEEGVNLDIGQTEIENDAFLDRLLFVIRSGLVQKYSKGHVSHATNKLTLNPAIAEGDDLTIIIL